MFLTVRENLARSYKFENCSSSWDFTLLLHGKHQILHGLHQVLHGKHQIFFMENMKYITINACS